MKTLNGLFDLSKTIAENYLRDYDFPWQIIPRIEEIIILLQKALGAEYVEVLPDVFVHKSALVAPSAHIGAPCIVGADTEIRHCAFIRGKVILGEGCVIGNSTELKNCILFDGVQVPHFNYVGDSILGNKAHLGAGAIISNVRSDKGEVKVKQGNEVIFTGLKKFGAAVGDFAEIGCNTVLNPGTVVERRAIIYPLSSVRGTIPEGSIFKGK